MYKINDRVKIAHDNENESYNEFKGVTLIIIQAERGGIGYDHGVYPQLLMEFETEDGIEFPFSLYEYEIEFE